MTQQHRQVHRIRGDLRAALDALERAVALNNFVYHSDLQSHFRIREQVRGELTAQT